MLLDCEKARGDDKLAAKIIQQLGRQSSSKAETVTLDSLFFVHFFRARYF